MGKRGRCTSPDDYEDALHRTITIIFASRASSRDDLTQKPSLGARSVSKGASDIEA